jgi:hypothetical protein
VSRKPDGQYGVNVSLFIGTATGGACAGTRLGHDDDRPDRRLLRLD